MDSISDSGAYFVGDSRDGYRGGRRGPALSGTKMELRWCSCSRTLGGEGSAGEAASVLSSMETDALHDKQQVVRDSQLSLNGELVSGRDVCAASLYGRDVCAACRSALPRQEMDPKLATSGWDAQLNETDEGCAREMWSARPGTPERHGEEASLETASETYHKKAYEKWRKGKIVRLNVGGQWFDTCIETLSVDSRSMLAAKVTRHMKDEDEIIFLDRDPMRFVHVLNYLRGQTVYLDEVLELRALQEEADFFNLDGLHEICEKKIHEILHFKDEQQRMEELKETVMVRQMEELKESLKKLTKSLENHKTNNRKEPILGGRRRRLDYGNLNEPVFRMDEDF